MRPSSLVSMRSNSALVRSAKAAGAAASSSKGNTRVRRIPGWYPNPRALFAGGEFLRRQLAVGVGVHGPEPGHGGGEELGAGDLAVAVGVVPADAVGRVQLRAIWGGPADGAVGRIHLR